MAKGFRLVYPNSPHSLRDRTTPANRGISEWAVGPENRKMVRTAARRLLHKWQTIVSRRTGRLASGGRVHSHLYSGKNLTSWTGTVEVKALREGKFNYALAHEFGYIRNGRRVEGHNELLKVLRMGDVI